MTKEKAIEILKQCADLCPASPLAEACKVAMECIADYEVSYLKGLTDAYNTMTERIEALQEKHFPKHDCIDCRNADRAPSIYPCRECTERYSETPSKWEPKEDGYEAD